MPKANESSTETLFHHWRRGDAGAGKAMAQRFTDWYYAISVSRLGELEGERPFRAACSKFSKGVVKVDDPRHLLGWAHNIARKQLHGGNEGGRLPDGDFPNAFTRRQSPKALLVQAREALPDQVELLEATYRGQIPADDPIQVLNARYQVKSWLRDNADIPFKVTPRDADPDRAPLPLYEAGRLANDSEDVHFELYMLSEQEVCQDVAEFAHYAIALRGGLAPLPPGQRRQRRAVPSSPPASSSPPPVPVGVTQPSVRPAPTSAPQRPPKAAQSPAMGSQPPPAAAPAPPEAAPPEPEGTNPTTVVLLLVVVIALAVGLWAMRGG